MSTSADIHGGRRIGKYETLTLLSMGGMAELYLAFTAGPGGFRKFVALKQILPDIKKDESFRTMFLDEARITAAFSHSNIGQVFDLGEDDGELYLAMEFISGQNLEQVVKVCRKKERELPVGYAALVARDTCLALHYAHNFVEPSGKTSPVIHRDVSPKNVMVTYDGNVKVVDFGIAKAKGRLNRTQAGMVKGTTGYMSPEQVRNQELDGRSDLFSAAVMLHEFLTGQRLFDGASDAVTMMQIVEGEIPSARALNPKVPEALDQVLMKALAKKREDRYATGKELARAIDAAMAGEVFDEEDAAAFMQELFAEKVKKTRALLEMASRSDNDLSLAAGELRDEEARSGTPGARAGVRGTPPPRESGRSPRTPAPRQARGPISRPRPAGEEGGSRTPPPRSGRTPSGRRPPPPRRPPRESAVEAEEEEAPLKDRWASKVASDLAQYAEDEEQTDSRASRPAAGENATSVRPALARPTGKRRWYQVSFFWVFLLILVGGLSWASTRLDGKLGDVVRPWYFSAVAWVNKEFAGEPPPPPPRPLTPPPGYVPPPPTQPPSAAPGTEAAGAVAEGEEGAAQTGGEVAAAGTGEAEKERGSTEVRREPKERRSTDPKRPGRRARSGSGAEDGKGEGERVARQGGEAAAEGSTRPAGAGGAEPATTASEEPVEVVVLDTSSARAAEDSGVGWLTLYTVPPAFVFDGATRLGTTPLRKLPLPVGTYRLRILDAESKYRMLSAPIKAGKVTELKIRVADLPLAKAQD